MLASLAKFLSFLVMTSFLNDPFGVIQKCAAVAEGVGGLVGGSSSQRGLVAEAMQAKNFLKLHKRSSISFI